MAVLAAGVGLWGCGGASETETAETEIARTESTATDAAADQNRGTAGDGDLCRLPATPPSPQDGFTPFSDYAWRLFVALNWPAEGGRRGVPDCEAPLGGGPTVWETYKTVDQIFLPGAKDPGPWDGEAAGPRVLLFRSKVPRTLPVEEGIRQAVGGWLIDQAGNPTYYQVAVDETSYDYVRDNRYYDASVVSRAPSIDFPTGSLEVKGSWRILGEDEPADRYHTQEALVMQYDDQGKPTGRTVPATVGLVGLHVVYKAAGFPQWIWATFEHRDNAPTDPSVTAGQPAAVDAAEGPWAYFDPDCTGSWCEPNVSPLESGQPFGSPNQIVRITAITPEVAAVNARWQQQVAGTPFEHYELISPQWPTAPDDPGRPQGAPTPDVVANMTMESYIPSTSSCMDCHSTARVPGDAVKSNYSFLFLFAQEPASEGGAS